MDANFIRLADGTLIDTRTGKAAPSTEINKAFSDAPSSSLVRGKGLDGVGRRYLDDLPTTPIQSRAVAIILAYTVFGLHEIDIAKILNTPVDNVKSVQESEPYARFLEAVLANIRDHDQDKIRKKINKAAEKAADKIVELSSSPDEKVALTASKDILDRVDRVGDRNGIGSIAGITIRIIDDRTEDHPVEVNIDG
jgi:hypothetical protein